MRKVDWDARNLKHPWESVGATALRLARARHMGDQAVSWGGIAKECDPEAGEAPDGNRVRMYVRTRHPELVSRPLRPSPIPPELRHPDPSRGGVGDATPPDLGCTQDAAVEGRIEDVFAETVEIYDVDGKHLGAFTGNPDNLPVGLYEMMLHNQRLGERVQQFSRRDQVFLAAIESAIEAIPRIDVLPVPRYDGASGQGFVAVPINSDMQIGTEFASGMVAGLAHFSSDEFAVRLKRWVKLILAWTENYRHMGPVDVLDMPFLGDNVEGETIFPGQAHLIDMPVINQLFWGGMMISSALITLLKLGGYRTIRTRWVHGNHGRVGDKKSGNHPSTNFDLIFAKTVEAYSRLHPELDFLISEPKFHLYEIPECPGIVHLATHGDQVKGSLSIPYYGVDRAYARYCTLAHVPLDFMYIGHHHRAAQIDNVRGVQIVNGNWVGGSELAVSSLVTGSHASQKLLFFHPEHGLVGTHELILSRMKPLKPDKDLLYTPVYPRFGTPEMLDLSRTCVDGPIP